jgi:hypothetical protein
VIDASAYVCRTAIPAALSLLPENMDSAAARLLLMAIGFQESAFEHRVQVHGPARGFWQFEKGGVQGVLLHHASSVEALKAINAMGYRTDREEVHAAIRDNDILAAVMARLLLWTHARALPEADDVEGAWQYYLSLWRPGRPHRDRWDANHAKARAFVKED